MRRGLDPGLRAVALLVAGSYFMENLDGTIVTTAAPRIGHALGVASTSVNLVIAAYLVTLAMLIPLSGWLAQRYGARPVYLTAIAVFTIASLACALSTSFAELVAFRVLQGAGGAMMVPVGRLIVLARTAKSDVLKVIALLVWPALIAPVIAPLAGALIVTYANWRWLFLINVPLGAIALALAWRIVRSPRTETPDPLDSRGVVLTCVGLGAATYMAYELSLSRIAWVTVIVCAVAAIVLLSTAVVHLRRTRFPLINLATLRARTLRFSVTTGSVFWAVVQSVPFVLTLLFQDAFGWSPVKSGLLVAAIFAGNVAIKPLTTPLLHRFGFRTVLVTATGGAMLTLVACALLRPGTPLAVIVLIGVLNGCGRSVSLTCYSTIAFADTREDQLRDANTFQATAQQLAVGLAAPLGAIALRAGRAIGGLGLGLTPGYGIGFLLLGVLALGACVAAARMPADAGAAVTRRPAATEGA